MKAGSKRTFEGKVILRLSRNNNIRGQKSIVPTIRDGILDNADALGYETPDPRGYFLSQQ